MEKLTSTHLFGLMLTIGTFYGIAFLRDKLKKSWLNPLILSIVVIIAVLLLFKIPYKRYMIGGSIINAFLGPVTVVLALPLYRQRKLLIEHKYSIMGGIIAGVTSAITSVMLLSKMLGISDILEKSLIGHSVTTPIGIQLSHILQATEGITVLSIILTGIVGAVAAPFIYKLLHIVHPVARGIGMGTCSHVFGTTKALEMGETEGAMSSLAIGVAALTTVVTVIVMQLFHLY